MCNLNHAPGRAMVTQPLSQLGGHGSAGQTGIGRKSDQQTDILASGGKVPGNPRNFMDPINLKRGTLHLIEINRMAALHDDILEPPHDPVPALLVAAEKISGPQPASVEGSLCGVRIAIVPIEYRRTRQLKLPFARPLYHCSVAITQPGLEQGRGAKGVSAHAALIILTEERGAHGFGEPVGVEQAEAESALKFLLGPLR